MYPTTISSAPLRNVDRSKCGHDTTNTKLQTRPESGPPIEIPAPLTNPARQTTRLALLKAINGADRGIQYWTDVVRPCVEFQPLSPSLHRPRSPLSVD